MEAKDKLEEEITQSLEAIFKNTERIHGKSEALDWIKIASSHASKLLMARMERYFNSNEARLKEELVKFFNSIDNYKFNYMKSELVVDE